MCVTLTRVSKPDFVLVLFLHWRKVWLSASALRGEKSSVLFVFLLTNHNRLGQRKAQDAAMVGTLANSVRRKLVLVEKQVLALKWLHPHKHNHIKH